MNLSIKLIEKLQYTLIIVLSIILSLYLMHSYDQSKNIQQSQSIIILNQELTLSNQNRSMSNLNVILTNTIKNKL